MRVSFNNTIQNSFYTQNIQKKQFKNTDQAPANMHNSSKDVFFKGYDVFRTCETTEKVTPAENIELFDIEQTAFEIFKEYNEKYKNTFEKMEALKKRQKDTFKEVNDLYSSNAAVTKDLRKVEKKGDTLFEYAKDGKTVVRKTVFDMTHEEYKKVPSFWTHKPVLKSVISPIAKEVIEENEDGSLNLITPMVCKIGYKVESDGSISCDEILSLELPPKDEDFKPKTVRCYGENYKATHDGKKISYGKTLYRSSNGDYNAHIFRENEVEYPGTWFKEADVQYEYEFFPEIPKQRGERRYHTYYEGYEERADGQTTRYAKRMDGLNNFLTLYQEFFQETRTNGRKEWRKYYTRDSKYSKWEKIKPKYERLSYML